MKIFKKGLKLQTDCDRIPMFNRVVIAQITAAWKICTYKEKKT